MCVCVCVCVQALLFYFAVFYFYLLQKLCIVILNRVESKASQNSRHVSKWVEVRKRIQQPEGVRGFQAKEKHLQRYSTSCLYQKEPRGQCGWSMMSRKKEGGRSESWREGRG